MKAEDIINLLKIKGYTFELKENQVIVRLARRYFLKLYIENDTVVKNEDIVKQFGLLANGKSLKVATKINMIFLWVFCILPIALFCIFEPDFFSSFSGKMFIITFVYVMLYPLLEFWYYNKRLSKIKKLLNFND